MIIQRLWAVAASVAVLCATQALADPKPKGAKRLDAQTVANMYAGKTVPWKTCKGGIFFGAKFQAQSYCNKSGPSVGLGKWKVTSKGSICHELVYYWPQGDSFGSKPQDKNPDCINHLVDADGQIWHNWLSDNDWWRGFPKDKNFSKGNKYKRQIAKNRKKLGV